MIRQRELSSSDLRQQSYLLVPVLYSPLVRRTLPPVKFDECD